MIQQPIMSMEDDDMSDQEVVSTNGVIDFLRFIFATVVREIKKNSRVLYYLQGQLEDHGPFKVLNKLWQHHAHLAVFMNYVLSNSDPSSLVNMLSLL